MLGLIVVIAFVFYFLIWVSVNAQLQAVKNGTLPVPAGGTTQLEQTLRQIAPDRVAQFGVSVVAGLGSVMLIVFAASHVGTEFGWGTFRTLLAHGASRSGFLVSKAVSLVLYAVVFMIVGSIAAIAASYTVSAVAGISPGSGVDFAEVARVAVKSGYTFLPYSRSPSRCGRSPLVPGSQLGSWSTSPRASSPASSSRSIRTTHRSSTGA